MGRLPRVVAALQPWANFRCPVGASLASTVAALRRDRSAESGPGLQPLLLPALHFLDALGHGQILRHRAAQFVNGLANFATDFVVKPVGVIFVPHVFAAELFLGLRGAEKIGASSVLPM